MAALLAAIVAWSLQAAALVAATGMALASARVRSPHVRLAAWRLTTVLAATMPFVLRGLAVEHPDSVRFHFEALAGVPRVAAAAAPGIAGPILGALVGVAIVRVVLLLVAWWRLRRSAARASTLSSPVFDAVCDELGVHARLVGTESGSPYAFGRRSPVVAVDPQVLADERTARAVFIHELVHIARGDCSRSRIRACPRLVSRPHSSTVITWPGASAPWLSRGT